MDEITKLKAAAYDQLANIEQAQANIRAINQRIQELTMEAQNAKEPESE